jgi:endonuclease/exonuclease/phosphatase (EEP) superfamily protein YafD
VVRGLAAGVALALLPAAVASARLDPAPPPQEIVPGIVIEKAPKPPERPERPEPHELQPPPKRKDLVRIPSATEITMAHANILRSLGPAQYAADLRAVMVHQPDFVTLNEAVKPEASLAVPGYDLYRGTHSRWTMETTVMWRTDRWQLEATGTRYLHIRPGKWGTRAVNWVRLQHVESGRLLTVVSAHPSPEIPSTRGLRPIYMGRLSALVREQAVYGPVFVGGDLNAPYGTDRFPRGALTAAGLAPTFDVFGRPPGGTGDHFGATIDYLLYQPAAGVAAEQQQKIELNSDHDALIGQFRWSW